MSGHGGARSRSGPPKNLFSGRTQASDLELVELPARGFRGYIPVFPLPKQDLAVDSERVYKRELALWKQIWRTPQAAVWSREKWRQLSVAQFVRLAVRVEEPTAKAADSGAMLRLQDHIGLTPTGMSLNGWVVAEDETAVRRAEKRAEESAERERAGFRVVRGG